MGARLSETEGAARASVMHLSAEAAPAYPNDDACRAAPEKAGTAGDHRVDRYVTLIYIHSSGTRAAASRVT